MLGAWLISAARNLVWVSRQKKLLLKKRLIFLFAGLPAQTGLADVAGSMS
jgi:hypothetical protein